MWVDATVGQCGRRRPGVGGEHHQRPRSWSTVADIIFSVLSCQVIRKMGHYLKMSLTVPAEYVEGFTRANNTFLYQLVFDPVRRKAVPLSPYPQHLDVSTLSYAGLYPSRPVTGDSASNSVLGSFYFEMDLEEAQLDIVADRKFYFTQMNLHPSVGGASSCTSCFRWGDARG